MASAPGVTVSDVTVNGVRVRCETRGREAAPPMVLLHALGEQAQSWAVVAERFATGFRVVSMDLRGHGGSDWPGAYSSQLMRDDVVAVLDELGLRDVVLVGHSLGGVVAILVALDRPDLVARLVVEDVVPPYPRDRPVPDRPNTVLDFDWAVVPAIIGEVNAGDPETWSRLGSIEAPTLVVGGGPASHIPREKLADMADRIPTCDLVTIPVGHNVHEASPEEFTDVVLRWLRG